MPFVAMTRKSAASRCPGERCDMHCGNLSQATPCICVAARTMKDPRLAAQAAKACRSPLILTPVSYVDNFNDDGLECGPKLRDHRLFIWQNRIGACLIPFTQHEIDKDESPLDHDPQAGVYVYRNVIDTRRGTYRSPPDKPELSGSFLHDEGHLVGDHGSPVWPVIHFYQNTVLRRTPVFRGYFLFGLGAQGLHKTERDVFNNLFVQIEGTPGAAFVGMKQAEKLREGGNLLWSVKQGPATMANLFGKFRGSDLFQQSRSYYPPGWTTDDHVGDPKFVRLVDADSRVDLRLESGSPAIDGGVVLPAESPDALCEADDGPPDIGALPHGAEPWGVGIEGRLPLFADW
jgi:hypothetical protein